MTGFERRWCRALLDACLPPSRTDPRTQGLSAIDLSSFWPRFEAAAPLHLRLGLRLATWLFGLGPLLQGRAPLSRLSPDLRDDSLRRMARWPAVGPLLDLVKVVACWAFFQDADVQARVRGS